MRKENRTWCGETQTRNIYWQIRASRRLLKEILSGDISPNYA